MTRNLEPVELPKYAKCCLFSCFIIDTLTWIHVDQGATLSQPASLLLLFLSRNIPFTRFHFNIKYVSLFHSLKGLLSTLKLFKPFVNTYLRERDTLLCTSGKYRSKFFLETSMQQFAFF